MGSATGIIPSPFMNQALKGQSYGGPGEEDAGEAQTAPNIEAIFKSVQNQNVSGPESLRVLEPKMDILIQHSVDNR